MPSPVFGDRGDEQRVGYGAAGGSTCGRGRWEWCRLYGRLFLVVIVVLGTECFAPAIATAGMSGPDGRSVVQRGAVELGLLAGFWKASNQESNAFGNVPYANLSANFALPQAGLVVTDPLSAGYLTGSVTLIVEPLLAHFYKPVKASAFGGSLVFKYSLLSFGRWIPFWDAGAGVLRTDLEPRVPEQSTRTNFVLETGPGVQYLLTERVAVTLGVRFHHISNARKGESNLNLNATLGYFGLSFFVPE